MSNSQEWCFLFFYFDYSILIKIFKKRWGKISGPFQDMRHWLLKFLMKKYFWSRNGRILNFSRYTRQKGSNIACTWIIFCFFVLRNVWKKCHSQTWFFFCLLYVCVCLNVFLKLDSHDRLRTEKRREFDM